MSVSTRAKIYRNLGTAERHCEYILNLGNTIHHLYSPRYPDHAEFGVIVANLAYLLGEFINLYKDVLFRSLPTEYQRSEE